MTDPQHISRDMTHDHDEDPEQHIGNRIDYVRDPDWEVTHGDPDAGTGQAAI